MSSRLLLFIKEVPLNKKFVNVYNNITCELLKYFLEKSGSNNIVTSPYSFIALIDILLDGAGGETRDEMAGSFGFKSSKINILQDCLQEVRECLAKDKEVASANAIFTMQFDITNFHRDFLNKIKDKNGKIFVSKNLKIDISKWIKKQTKEMIPEISILIGNNVVMDIINVVAFDAKWAEEYNESDIIDGLTFNNIDNSKSATKFLSSEENIYIEDEGFMGFVKPYKKNNYSFVALLPKKEGDLALRNAVKKINLSKILFSGERCIVNVLLPEFECKSTFNLNSFCKSIGIKQAFTAKADFSNMVSEPVFMSSVDQQTFIKVDRKGSKAGLTTMAQFAFSGARKVEKIKNICFDRPFIYLIIHNDSMLPIIIGAMRSAR